MKAYRVKFDFNGVGGVTGVCHTWVQADSAENAMRNVELLTGYAAIEAIEAIEAMEG